VLLLHILVLILLLVIEDLLLLLFLLPGDGGGEDRLQLALQITRKLHIKHVKVNYATEAKTVPS
jgi:hypothetical protein